MRRPMAPLEPTEEEQRQERSEEAILTEIGDGLRREIAVVVGTMAPMPSREYLKKRLRCGLRALDMAASRLIKAQSLQVETNVDGLRWRARITRNGEWMPWAKWGER